MILSGRKEEIMEMTKIEMDIAWDSWGSLENYLIETGKEFPSIYARIVEENGSGGGWPVVEFVGTEADLRAFLEAGGDDPDEFLE
jgi:hypothetical protein